jgi:hypothetical protein
MTDHHPARHGRMPLDAAKRAKLVGEVAIAYNAYADVLEEFYLGEKILINATTGEFRIAPNEAEWQAFNASAGEDDFLATGKIGHFFRAA